MPRLPSCSSIPAIVCLTLSLALASTASHALDKLKVGVDWFINPDHAPLVVALESGYFSDVGLDVELVVPTTTQDNVTMVIDGRADIGMSDQPRTQIQVAGGSPLMIVGTLIPVPLNVILTLEDGPIKTIADLKGKRVGYADSAKTERELLRIALAAHDISLDDITLVDVEFTMVKALLDGKVDALTDTYRNFEPIQVTLAGKAPRVFSIEDEAIPPYSELVYITKRNTVDADTVAKFLSAVERGARALAENPDVTWQLFIKYAPKLDNELNRRAWAATLPFFALRPGTINRGRYERFADFLVENGVMSERPSSDDYLPAQH